MGNCFGKKGKYKKKCLFENYPIYFQRLNNSLLHRCVRNDIMIIIFFQVQPVVSDSPINNITEWDRGDSVHRLVFDCIITLDKDYTPEASNEPGFLLIIELEKQATTFEWVRYYLSRVMRIPDFCICEIKDADQLRGNREADQCLCFRYTDSTTPLLHKSEISSL